MAASYLNIIKAVMYIHYSIEQFAVGNKNYSRVRLLFLGRDHFISKCFVNQTTLRFTKPPR